MLAAAALQVIARGLARADAQLRRWTVGQDRRRRVQLTGWPPRDGEARWSLEPPPGDEDLDVIPSETSAAERRFLYRFFAHAWSGQGDVVEIGPFLGGTTRAIARGMLANPARSPDSLLHTYDRFEAYYYGDELRAYVEPLVAGGVIDASAVEAIGSEASFEGAGFRELFARIHSGTSYEALLAVRSEPLPDTPDEIRARPPDFKLPDRELSAFFVDGCKSWYATKHFVREAVPRASPGAYFLFQDYGWYTDFWIPAIVHLMRDSLALVSYVDQTYGFQLAGPMDDIDSLVPDTAEELGAEALARGFDALVDDASFRDDARAVVVHEIQGAAALAYVGAREEARHRLDVLAREHGRGPHRSAIAAARTNPTHRQVWGPEGVTRVEVTL
jgi:Methyltransferase domain